MDLQEAVEALAESAEAMSDRPGRVAGPHRICQIGADLVDGVEDVSLTIRDKQGSRTLGSSSELAEQLDQVQYRAGEGPCLEATVETGLIHSADLTQESRWPAWTPTAVSLGVGSLVCVQLLSGSDQLRGAINFYARGAGAWDDEGHDLAMLYATHASIALNASQVATGLSTAVASRHAIGVAQGILMTRFDLSVHDAFSVLRRYSSLDKLAAVAERIIREVDDGYASPRDRAAEPSG